jgi:tRNA pseudouridine55 synthase
MIGKGQKFASPSPPRDMDPFDGVLIVDKPAGPTSHDVVDRIRREFRFKKVGHGGTLDPQATGLLVILLGRGTKLSNVFMGSDKTYQGIMRLGIATDSQDAQGAVIREADCSSVTREQLESAMAKFMGDIFQTPPMVSAVKVDGVPLYKLARKGKTIEREPRLIHVYEFSLLKFEPPRAEFLLKCTKGVYVRTICADIGDMLGCGAHLEQLRRLQSGKIKIEDATPVSDILRMSRDELMMKIIPGSRFLTHGANE